MPSNYATVFGLRALAEFCLAAPSAPDQAQQVASWLADAEQYPLASRLFDKLNRIGALDVLGQLQFASSYSEEHQTVQGAETAIQRVRETLSAVTNLDQRLAGTDGGKATSLLAQCHRRLAALLQWKWQLTREAGDLQAAIDTFGFATSQMEAARANGAFDHPGLIAQARLKVMLLLRVSESDLLRHDAEGHAEAIMRLTEADGDHPVGVSYLHWFQCIVLADRGSEDASGRALDRLAADAQLVDRPDCLEIGRRQYVLLRRFLEQYSQAFRDREQIGLISRHLRARLAEGV